MRAGTYLACRQGIGSIQETTASGTGDVTQDNRESIQHIPAYAVRHGAQSFAADHASSGALVPLIRAAMGPGGSPTPSVTGQRSAP